jgi:hypothetical protein
MDRSADFFVSYASADRAWAEWIAWQLEAEGYQVIVQAWDFTPGRDWVHQMQQAISKAERVVAVLSAAYLRSAQAQAEWRSLLRQGPQRRARVATPGPGRPGRSAGPTQHAQLCGPGGIRPQQRPSASMTRRTSNLARLLAGSSLAP